MRLTSYPNRYRVYLFADHKITNSKGTVSIVLVPPAVDLEAVADTEISQRDSVAAERFLLGSQR